jgi:hypothetical protein
VWALPGLSGTDAAPVGPLRPLRPVPNIRKNVRVTRIFPRAPRRVAIGLVIASASLGWSDVVPRATAAARNSPSVIEVAATAATAATAAVNPSTLAFGLANAPGSVAQMTSSGIAWNYRYQYLAGGVNTGNGWTTWVPNARFPAEYMSESADNGYTPVFTLYQLLQSKPAAGTREDEKDFTNLNNADTMRAYYTEFRTLLDQARAFDRPVIIHVEPDLAGYMQQRVVDTTNSAASVPAAVASSGLADLAGLPNTYQGFNQALLRLRDRVAPKALLAIHASAWSTKIDVSSNKDANIDVDGVARKTAEFLSTAGVDTTAQGISTYDLIFTDVSDRDAAFHQIVNGDGGASWWDATNTKLPNFSTFNRYLAALSATSGRKVFLWQVPMGNTVMRTENNTWNHYQDNRVQYWLGGYPGDNHLASLARSGVAAILWGRGADGGTSVEDAAHDGVTNPPAINGNDRLATSSDDDGGYLKERMLAYQHAGPLRIERPVAAPSETIPTKAPPTTTGAADVGFVTAAKPAAASTPATTGTVAPAEFLLDVPTTGRHTFSFTATTSDAAAAVRVELDGVPVSGRLLVPRRTPRRRSVTLSTRAVIVPKGRHTLTIVTQSGRVTVSAAQVR